KKYRNGEITQDRLRYGRLKTTFDALGFAVTDSKLHRLSKAYIQHLTTFNHLFPNTITLLKYLSEQYDLHIITNGFAEIQNKKLSNSSIIHYFKVIVNSDMAGVKKPHPAIFQMALRKAKVAPSLALMIGDNLEADILGAQRQGMAAVHFNSNREPTHKYCPIVYGLNEIKHLL
ncbi:MAG: HAD-IA family hydrolase, partial [Bacteroidota bacterium]